MTDYLEDQGNREITESKQQLVTGWKGNMLPTLLAIGGVMAACGIAAIAFWRFRRRSFQYKNSSGRSRQHACRRGGDEEFSEVRYLTADEQLDFNLASPDGD